MILTEDNFFLETSQDEEQALTEGFWTQWFKGHDDELLQQLRSELAAGIKTEYDRKQALEKIDSAIDNSNRTFYTGSDAAHWFADLGLAFLGGAIGVLVKLIVRLSNTDQRKAFRETLHKIRAEIVALKIKG